MRSSSVLINLVLNRQRKNQNGQMPVYLRLTFKGERKLLHTNVYVPENQWDTKTQTVKPTYKGFSELNQTLYSIKQKYILIRDSFIKRGIPYTVSDLVGGDTVKAGLSDNLLDILESMSMHKGLSHNTVMAYRASVRRLNEAGVYRLSEVSPDSVQGLCKRLKGNDLSDSSVNVTMACLGSLWKYGVDLGLCEGYLFSRFKHWKKYRINQKHRSLPKEVIDNLLSYFLSQCVSADGLEGAWWYTIEGYKQLMNRNSELFALAACLIGYYCRGLAFCDLVRIKSEHISVIDRNGVSYYRISGLHRKKTNVVIPDIYIKVTDDVMPLFHCYIDTMNERDGYFLPVLQNNDMTYKYGRDEKKISEATGTCSVVVNKKLRQVMEKLGYESTGISYYCFRHSVASHYMASNGNPVYLATMMARSVSGIFRYVRSIESAEDLIRESTKIYSSK